MSIFISIFFLISCLTLVYPINGMKIERRFIGSVHKGYQCNKKKHNMYDIEPTLKSACKAYIKRKQKKWFFIYFINRTVFKRFSESKRFGFPPDTQITPVLPKGLGKISLYVMLTLISSGIYWQTPRIFICVEA
ncbi:CSEP0364 putative effector protein [Blumeria hordei DH14]|uniref:CSEP0364 putative effector protein n=1 Tax=Blumeria graminis f. sp. hordei (strain DH14) TaxID=546991 RepID=N1J8R1_BLUG1|nr:CSEP0364 putative effector protein [Blumeria hordei DH14]